MIERVVTSGTFSIDGEDFAVDNNVWLVGDDAEVLVIDAAHDHEPIVAAVGDRRVVAIVATHGHNDHINAGAALAEATGAPIWLHHDERRAPWPGTGSGPGSRTGRSSGPSGRRMPRGPPAPTRKRRPTSCSPSMPPTPTVPERRRTDRGRSS